MAEKLVRDLIPAWDIDKGGERSVFRLAAPEEMEKLLLAKVMEEAEEVTSAPDAASMLLEVADLFEVVYALAALYEWVPEDIEFAREVKAALRGRFSAGIVLVTEDRRRSEMETSDAHLAQLVWQWISDHNDHGYTADDLIQQLEEVGYPCPDDLKEQ